jgi:hypothetical protein
VHPGSGAHWRENDGYSDSEWFDAQSEPEGPPVQNGNRLQLAHVIFEHYHDDYNNAFPDWPLLTFFTFTASEPDLVQFQ